MRTSAELNEALSGICDDDGFGYHSAVGDKAIPYIGWFWRRVNFDAPGPYVFGVIPAGTADAEVNGRPIGPLSKGNAVGFMENNKWNYPEVLATPAQWQEIRRLTNEVCDRPCRDTLSLLDSAIQSLAKGKKWEAVVVKEIVGREEYSFTEYVETRMPDDTSEATGDASPGGKE